jgi:uncharacterized membrane protein
LPGICRFRFWRWLNLLGAAWTFVVLGAWILLSYQPEMFFRVEPFLLGFVAIFVLITLISAQKREFSFRRPADAILPLSLPFIAAFFQWGIARELPHGLSLSALSLGILFLALAALVWKRWGAALRRLAEFYLVSGMVLAHLALPLEVSGFLSSAVWAAEGAVFFYFACRLGSDRLKIAGLVIQAAAFALCLKELANLGPADHPLPGMCMLALAALASGFFQSAESARRARNGEGGAGERPIWSVEALSEKMKFDRLLTVCGLFYWYAGLAAESLRFADDPLMAFFLASGLSAALFFLLVYFLKYTDLFLANLPTALLSLTVLLSSLVISLSAYFQADSTDLLPLTHQFLSGTEGLAWLAFAFSQAVFFLTARNKAPAAISSWWATITTLELLLVATSSCRALALDLVGLDTAKLLLFDLADKGALLRVVSFFIVGGIFLLIGFLAPLPPRRKTDYKDEEPKASAAAGSENSLPRNE